MQITGPFINDQYVRTGGRSIHLVLHNLKLKMGQNLNKGSNILTLVPSMDLSPKTIHFP